MQAFLEALSLIFAAEAGDKSQLLVLAMATKYPLLPMLLGIISAIILTQLFAATLGFCIGEAIPLRLINLFAGVLFIYIGLKTLLAKPEATEEAAVTNCTVNPFWRVFSLYTLGELGDKTQITCILLASQNKNLLATFLGAVLAMLLANLLSLFVGRVAGSRLSVRTIKIVSSVLYLCFGIFSLGELF